MWKKKMKKEMKEKEKQWALSYAHWCYANKSKVIIYLSGTFDESLPK